VSQSSDPKILIPFLRSVSRISNYRVTASGIGAPRDTAAIGSTTYLTAQFSPRRGIDRKYDAAERAFIFAERIVHWGNALPRN
jgi:hypothetical protein